MAFLRKRVYLGLTKSGHLDKARELTKRAGSYSGSGADELYHRDMEMAHWHRQAADKIELDS